MHGRAYRSVGPLHSFGLLTNLCFPVDIQPRNIMIQLEDAESVVRDHLEWPPHRPNGSNEDRHSAACYPNSEALTTEVPHSTSDINIKIVDFGVGMSAAEIHILKAEMKG